jgi:hypothetical protein
MKKERRHHSARAEGDHSATASAREDTGFGPVRGIGLQPTGFYRWQKEFFENSAAAFQQKGRPNHPAKQERIAYREK